MILWKEVITCPEAEAMRVEEKEIYVLALIILMGLSDYMWNTRKRKESVVIFEFLIDI